MSNPLIKYPITSKASFSKHFALELLRPNKQLKNYFNNIVRTAKRPEHKVIDNSFGKAYTVQSESSTHIKRKMEHSPFNVARNLIKQIKTPKLKINERPKSTGASRGRKLIPKLLDRKKVLVRLFL